MLSIIIWEFIHVFEGISSSFLIVNWVYIPQFVHPIPLDDDLGCFQFGAVTNEDAMNVWV